jgi:hypothetical protein
MRTALMTLAAIILLVVVGTMGRIPGTPESPPAAPNKGPDCQVTQIAESGAPLARTDMQRAVDRWHMCEDLRRAETQPPKDPATNAQGDIPARQACVDLQQQGFLQGQDCNRIPADQVWHQRK